MQNELHAMFFSEITPFVENKTKDLNLFAKKCNKLHIFKLIAICYSMEFTDKEINKNKSFGKLLNGIICSYNSM